MIHRIAMQVRASASTGGRDAFGEHANHLIELTALQQAITPRAPHQAEQFVLFEIFAGAGGNNLLRQDVE